MPENTADSGRRLHHAKQVQHAPAKAATLCRQLAESEGEGEGDPPPLAACDVVGSGW